MDAAPFNLAALAAGACSNAYAMPSIKVGNAQAWVNYSPSVNLAAIAFAGTNDVRDVLQDARFCCRVKIGKIRVHRGFWKHAQLIGDATKSAYQSLNIPPDAKTIVTGHSLGAAVAVIEMFRRGAYFRNATGILFGCPRVGNWRFANAFVNCVRFPVWRFVSSGDPIAHLPFPWLGRWRHVGQKVTIGKGFDIKADHPLNSYMEALHAEK